MKKSKAKPGRPVVGGERKERYQVALEPAVADKLRELGGDNLSRGIAIGADMLNRREVAQFNMARNAFGAAMPKHTFFHSEPIRASDGVLSEVRVYSSSEDKRSLLAIVPFNTDGKPDVVQILASADTLENFELEMRDEAIRTYRQKSGNRSDTVRARPFRRKDGKLCSFRIYDKLTMLVAIVSILADGTVGSLKTL